MPHRKRRSPVTTDSLKLCECSRLKKRTVDISACNELHNVDSKIEVSPGVPRLYYGLFEGRQQIYDAHTTSIDTAKRCSRHTQVLELLSNCRSHQLHPLHSLHRTTGTFRGSHHCRTRVKRPYDADRTEIFLGHL